ncbi:unnamed protein product [Dovyalis caffra]|uniref:BHLH domain-containing protein n=1 Tax=Dovyalis caffra TaxID=77055 RepID=A0AAV1RNZ8_9ROSI|nr:unnamed protein product [Dovyalis caffra]
MGNRDNFQDDFEGSADTGCDPTLQATNISEPVSEFPGEQCKGEPSRSKRNFEEIIFRNSTTTENNVDIDKLCGEPRRKKHDQRPKRIRSADMHNIYERRRRDQINEKLRNLQKLLPNCRKHDRVSMLEDAVEHIKALKLQVKMMCRGGGAILWQTPSSLPQVGIPNMQVPQFSQFAPIKPFLGMGMGMFGMCHSLGPPMISLPSACLQPSLSTAAAAGMHPISAHGNVPIPANAILFFTTITCNHSRIYYVSNICDWILSGMQ